MRNLVACMLSRRSCGPKIGTLLRPLNQRLSVHLLDCRPLQQIWSAEKLLCSSHRSYYQNMASMKSWIATGRRENAYLLAF